MNEKDSPTNSDYLKSKKYPTEKENDPPKLVEMI